MADKALRLYLTPQGWGALDSHRILVYRKDGIEVLYSVRGRLVKVLNLVVREIQR